MYRSPHSKNHFFTAKLALMALLLSLVAATASATPGQADRVQFPDHETLQWVFKNLVTYGHLSSDATTTEVPDEQTLKQIYEYALTSGHLDSLLFDDMAPAEDAMTRRVRAMVPERDLPQGDAALRVEKAPSAACLAKNAECIGLSRELALVCTAEFAANFVFGTAACLVEMATAGVGDICAEANDICGYTQGHIPTSQSQFKGQSSGSSSTQTCGGSHRVAKLYYWWDTHYQWGITVISKIQMVCTDNRAYNFGVNNGVTGTYGWGSYCGTGYLMQGMNVRAGSLIDGAAPRCDPAKNTTTSDWIGSWRGGNGGVSSTMLCAEGKYMYGMRVYTTSHPDNSKRYIAGMNALCK